MKSHDFDVIPAGRVMFVPGFVVLAARRNRPRWNRIPAWPSTRKHLLAELHMLATAFDADP